MWRRGQGVGTVTSIHAWARPAPADRHGRMVARRRCPRQRQLWPLSSARSHQRRPSRGRLPVLAGCGVSADSPADSEAGSVGCELGNAPTAAAVRACALLRPCEKPGRAFKLLRFCRKPRSEPGWGRRAVPQAPACQRYWPGRP